MALPNVVQTAHNKTTTLGPASITTTCSATAVGTCLALVVASALGGAPTISTPASWIAGPVFTQGTVGDLRLFYYPNNPGGITTALNNLTNVNGCATSFFEISGINTTTVLDWKDTNSGQNPSANSLSVPVYGSHAFGNILQIGMIANDAAHPLTQGYINGNSAWQAAGSDTSTTGTTNVQLTGKYISEGAVPSGLAQVAGTLSGNGWWIAATWSFVSTSSNQLAFAGATLNTGAGQGYAQGI